MRQSLLVERGACTIDQYPSADSLIAIAELTAADSEERIATIRRKFIRRLRFTAKLGVIGIGAVESASIIIPLPSCNYAGAYLILHQMVKCQPSLDRVFAALSDPTRRAIVSHLVEGQRTVGQLAEPFDISASGFSKHLRVLERAGLLRQHKRGRERYCEVLVEPLESARTWLDEHRAMWNATLDSFAEYAESIQSKRRRKRKK